MESQEEDTMTTSLIKPNTIALTASDSSALESSLIEDTSPGGHRDEHSIRVEGSLSILGTEPPSDKVIGLREWGTGRMLSLRTPPNATEAATNATAVQLARGALATTADKIEIVYESQSWRIRDLSGLSNLRQDGRPTREVSLMPGAEITIAGRTFIVESSRSIALRDFCSRLLGWTDDRLTVVDHALRAIRLASAGRAPLML